MILDLSKQRHKIFCWVQDPQLHNVAPHGLALGDDGVMLGICQDKLPSTIMPSLSRLAPMYDDHFGKDCWELVFVDDFAVQNVGTNIAFDNAINKNNILAKETEI